MAITGSASLVKTGLELLLVKQVFICASIKKVKAPGFCNVVTAVLLQQSGPVPIDTQQQDAGKPLRFIFPLKVYTSTPGVNVPGVLVLQFLQMLLVRLHNCTASNTIEPGAIGNE